MTTELILDEYTQNIVKKYTVMYKIIFQYSLFFIPALLGIIFALTLQSAKAITPNQNINRSNQTFSIADGIYKPNKISDEVGPIFDGFGDVKILGGILQATGKVLIGKNNLITLADIVLPENPYIINIGFTGTVKTFESASYNVADLKRVMDNWILATQPQNQDTGSQDLLFFGNQDQAIGQESSMDSILQKLQKKDYFPGSNATNAAPIGIGNSTGANKIKIGTGLKAKLATKAVTTPIIAPQNQTLIETYNLSCLTKWKVYDGYCNSNLEKFIKAIPALQLETKWDDMLAIGSAIQNQLHLDAFCTNLTSNFLHYPYPSTQLDIIMGGTCSNYADRYNKIKDFLRVENELASIPSESMVNNNLDANLFKLTSLWQKLYAQNLNDSLDTTTVVSYLRFVDGLIHQSSMKVPQFYIEATYYYNNVYLKTILQNLLTNTISPSVKNEISGILDEISSLNQGNATIGVHGLVEFVKNKTLTQAIKDGTGTFFTNISNFSDLFNGVLQGFPTLRVSDTQLDETAHTARMIAILRFKDSDGQDRGINLIGDFKYADNEFIVTSLRTPQNPVIDNIIMKYLTIAPNTPLDTLIQLIKNNSTYVKTNITFCDILQSQPNIQVSSCTASNASVSIDTSVITLSINNDVVTQATSTNAALQTFMKTRLSNHSANGDSLGAFVAASVGFLKPKASDPNTEAAGSIDINKLSIITKFKTFLKTEPTDIQNQNGKWIVSFTLKGIKFAAVINIENNYKLSPLVVQGGAGEIPVANFGLTLITFSQNRITQFIDDPLNYIKQIDENAYNQIVKK